MDGDYYNIRTNWHFDVFSNVLPSEPSCSWSLDGKERREE